MTDENNNIVPAHSVETINSIDVRSTSESFKSKNILVHTLTVSPFNAVFQEVPSLLIGMTTAGFVRGECTIGKRVCQIDLPPNSIFIVPPHTSFEARIETCAEIITVYIADRVFKDIEKEFLEVGGNQFQLRLSCSASDPFLTQTILSMKEVVERGGTFARIEMEYLARVLTARMMANNSNRGPSETDMVMGLPATILSDIVTYIHQNLDRRITPSRLSAMAGLGPAQFARLFKRSTNVTLHQYIILQRIERAGNLLRETDIPIIEIAQECGFADQVHLTRFFNRIVGTSPASFRRRFRGIVLSRTSKL